MRAGLAISALCAIGLCVPAMAQDYPARPIRVIVATSAGGTSDIFIRAVGEEFHKRTGQPLVVENRSGGGMNIGGRACADAPNDGYAICILPNETLTLNQYLYKKLTYNPETDFEPITNPFFNTQVVVASASLGVRSLADLAAMSKAKRGSLSYTALSVPLQMFMEEWKKKTGADIVAVPARGGGDVVTGVLTGSVPVAIVGIPNWLPHIREGAVVPLAVNSQQRSPLLPDVPTIGEIGFPDEAQMYFGIVAPAGTPKHVIEKLFSELKTIGEEPRFRQQRIIEQGLVPVFNRPQEFGAYLAAERVAAKRRFIESGMEQR
ncbi:MAG: tripartite tricarboxylate transporter substrate binding protein [Hyphomicrobiales bacterium]|nr:tripartite tricarboxylate transporter substrate binding protein [Hyphomicrobiales bacterium]